MNRIIKNLSALIFSLGLTGTLPAGAADLPAKAAAAATPAAVNWTGLYLDAYFQYGANITNTDFAMPGFTADLASSPHGPGIGGSLGYLYDTGTFVIGPRVDLSYLNLSGSGQIANGALSFSNATNYLGNVDLEIGLPITSDRRLLAYAVGGFAFGGAKPNLTFGTLSAAASDTSTGWNVGAGLRYKLPAAAFPLPTQIFIEGDYYQLGDKQLTAMDPLTGAAVATSTAKYHIVTQKFGMGWSF